jgi:pimeloyl-ACP methyl ester carboxylesterase
MVEKRSRSLRIRGRDLANVLSRSSPPRNEKDDWRYCTEQNTLFLSGRLDWKYTRIGENLAKNRRARHKKIDGAGHALLVDAPIELVSLITDFVDQNTTDNFELKQRCRAVV